MSDAAIPEEIARDLALADRSAYLEQRLFVFSPFGTLITALLIWLLLIASFVAIAFAEHLPLLVSKGGATVLDPRWRAALTISLLLVTILGAQRYSRVRERVDFAAFAVVLRGGVARAFELAGLTPRGVNLTGATIAGLILGLLVAWLFNIGKPGADRGFVAWMSVIIALLCILFVRGVTLTRVSGRLTRDMIDRDLIIDLLRVDRLAVVGRSAARSALIWFTISAVTCLFFIGGGMDAFTIALLIGCAAMGVWIFVATMARVHHKIRAAKAEELERVRADIEAACADTEFGHRLPGLLAYEARISAVHEWPFDQTTLVRVVASAFILALPWFGQAIAAFAVERFADIAK